MYDKPVRRPLLALTLLLGAAGAFCAGVAFAADPKLDEATDAIVKAVALLKAADNPNVARGPEFAGHRLKAIQHLEAAQAEIARAKAFADRPAPPPPPSGKKPLPPPKRP